LNWAGITLIVLYAANLGIVLSKDGEPREGKNSFLSSLISTLIILFLIYKAGGFS